MDVKTQPPHNNVFIIGRGDEGKQFGWAIKILILWETNRQTNSWTQAWFILHYLSWILYTIQCLYCIACTVWNLYGLLSLCTKPKKSSHYNTQEKEKDLSKQLNMRLNQLSPAMIGSKKLSFSLEFILSQFRFTSTSDRVYSFS